MSSSLAITVRATNNLDTQDIISYTYMQDEFLEVGLLGTSDYVVYIKIDQFFSKFISLFCSLMRKV